MKFEIHRDVLGVTEVKLARESKYKIKEFLARTFWWTVTFVILTVLGRRVQKKS